MCGGQAGGLRGIAAGQGENRDRRDGYWSEGLALRERSCAQGDGGQCYLAAGSYERGEGVARDTQRARELWRRGCTLGVRVACEKVGR